LAKTTLPFTLLPLSGGASDRWYSRLVGPLAERYGRESLILMGIAPALKAMFESFLRVRRFLAAHSIPVPRLYAEWLGEGLVLLEDFGDLTMTQAVREAPERKRVLYDGAVALLGRIHACADDPRDPCPAFDLHFDVEKYRYEFEFHVRTWVIGHYCDAAPTPAESATLERAFDWISRTLAAEPRIFTHRDYQTSNLMVRPEGTLGLLDFQDARQGLRQYDLASLLYDSYVDFEESERDRLADAYCRLVFGAEATDDFARLLRVAAIQRKLHDAGAFVYAAAHRGKAEYLAFVPDTLRLATDLMATIPECREAAEVLSALAGRGK